MKPAKLDMYRLAVQHPEAEVTFLLRCYRHYRGELPTRLKEDFAGTTAVAGQWVSLHEDMRALAVEADAATVRFAQRRATATLGSRAADLHLVHADVVDVPAPRVDVVAALNFSTFIYHERGALLRYLRVARRSLRPGGIFVMDAYGGPGALRLGVQERRVTPAAEQGVGPFTYRWEQRNFDAASNRVDCRIHFALANGRVMRDAFRYDWRLWSPIELIEALREVGFTRAEVWCDTVKRGAERSDGVYRPVRRIGARVDWVAYLVGVR